MLCHCGVFAHTSEIPPDSGLRKLSAPLQFRSNHLGRQRSRAQEQGTSVMAMVGGCMCMSSSRWVHQQQQALGTSRRQHSQGFLSSWSPAGYGRPSTSSLVERSQFLQGRKGEVVCQVAVKIGQSNEGKGTKVMPGSKIRVTSPLTVYHVGKLPNLNLEGLEGEVKDHIVEWKGKTVSATLPYKVQFVREVDGKSVKFFAHLRDDEFEVVE